MAQEKEQRTERRSVRKYSQERSVSPDWLDGDYNSKSLRAMRLVFFVSLQKSDRFHIVMHSGHHHNHQQCTRRCGQNANCELWQVGQ